MPERYEEVERMNERELEAFRESAFDALGNVKLDYLLHQKNRVDGLVKYLADLASATARQFGTQGAQLEEVRKQCKSLQTGQEGQSAPSSGASSGAPDRAPGPSRRAGRAGK